VAFALVLGQALVLASLAQHFAPVFEHEDVLGHVAMALAAVEQAGTAHLKLQSA
jgi:hypothetical protein